MAAATSKELGTGVLQRRAVLAVRRRWRWRRSTAARVLDVAQALLAEP